MSLVGSNKSYENNWYAGSLFGFIDRPVFVQDVFLNVTLNCYEPVYQNISHPLMQVKAAGLIGQVAYTEANVSHVSTNMEVIDYFGTVSQTNGLFSSVQGYSTCYVLNTTTNVTILSGNATYMTACGLIWDVCYSAIYLTQTSAYVIAITAV